MIIESRLQQLMKQHKMNQTECADKLDIPVRTFGGYKRCERDCPTDMLCRIADLFEVSTDYLLGRTDEPKLSAPRATANGLERDIVAPVSEPIKLDIDPAALGMSADALKAVIQSAIIDAIKKSHPAG